ncbi:MAG: hypothetical protein Q7T53_05490 [Deltaproteobacteria bacterium]|nr:hypothetical protein [Deltaproteobacteria bacterium]
MKIKRSLSYLVLSILSIILLIGKVSAQDKEVITNNTIIKMVKVKLGEDIIISKIRDSKATFDLSTDGLIKLKTAGVSDNIINAMQTTQQQSQPQPQVEQQQKSTPQIQQQTEHPSKAPTIPTSGDVFIMQRGKAIGMDYVLGFMKVMSSSSFSFKTKFVAIADGERAQFQIKDKNPVFYVKLRPEVFDIVKFDTDTYNKKPVRYVLFIQSAGDTRAFTKASRDFDYKKEPNGLYKITLKAPLENGDYGIIASPEQGGASFRIFDFAVVE